MIKRYLFDPNKQFQDKSGKNNVNGFLRVFIDNTDDRSVTYKDFDGTLNEADIRLDNNGRAIVIVDDSKTYRLEVYDSIGNMLWTAKPLYAIGANSGGVSPDDIKPLVLKQFGKNLGTYSPLNGNTITIGDSAVHVAVDHANIHAYLTEILADGRTPVLVMSDTDPGTPGVTRDFYFYPTARTGVDSDYSFIGYDGYVVKVATVHDDDTVTYAEIESQSDWNQTDPSAIDFIKNKPFVFIQRLVATYDEVTEAIQSGKIVLTSDGFRYCGTDDNKYFFSKVVVTGYYGARIEMSSVDTNDDWLTSQSTELLTLDFWNSAFFSYYSVGYHQDIGIYLKDCPLYQASVDATGLSVVQVQNNKFTKVTNFASSTLEIRAELECHDYTSEHAPNFVVEVTPSTACTVTVTTSKNYYDHPHWIPLSSSALTGTTMKANTTYQIRVIGAYWSLFEVDSSGTPSIGDIGQFHAAVTLLNTHVNDSNNPHNVTASQIGAESVSNKSQTVDPMSETEYPSSKAVAGFVFAITNFINEKIQRGLNTSQTNSQAYSLVGTLSVTDSNKRGMMAFELFCCKQCASPVRIVATFGYQADNNLTASYRVESARSADLTRYKLAWRFADNHTANAPKIEIWLIDTIETGSDQRRCGCNVHMVDGIEWINGNLTTNTLPSGLTDFTPFYT